VDNPAPKDSPAPGDNPAPTNIPARRKQDTLETFKIRRNQTTAFRELKSLDHHGGTKVIPALLPKF
jgi:hypothetical protein